MKLHKLFILFFLALIISVFNTKEFHCQEVEPEVGVDQTMIPTPTDSLTDKTKMTTGYIPPQPNEWNSIWMTTYGGIFQEYKYRRDFVTKLDDYNPSPKFAFIGVKEKFKKSPNVDDGTTELKQYNGLIGWYYDPKKNEKKYGLREYSPEVGFDVGVLESTVMNAWYPPIAGDKVDSKFLIDKDGDGYDNVILFPKPNIDPEDFKDVSESELQEYLRTDNK